MLFYFSCIWSAARWRGCNQTFWNATKYRMVTGCSSQILHNGADWQQGVNTNRLSPVRFYTDRYSELQCAASTVRAWLPVALDNQSEAAHSRAADLIPCYVLAKPLCRLHRVNHRGRVGRVDFVWKDIGRRVSPGGRWMRWADGAWSGWCSTRGCSHIRCRWSLQQKMHTRHLYLCCYVTEIQWRLTNHNFH